MRNPIRTFPKNTLLFMVSPSWMFRIRHIGCPGPNSKPRSPSSTPEIGFGGRSRCLHTCSSFSRVSVAPETLRRWWAIPSSTSADSPTTQCNHLIEEMHNERLDSMRIAGGDRIFLKPESVGMSDSSILLPTQPITSDDACPGRPGRNRTAPCRFPRPIQALSTPKPVGVHCCP